MKEMYNQLPRQTVQQFNTRIQMAVACKDFEDIDRHPLAGTYGEENGFKIQYMFNGIKMYYGTYYADWMNELIRQTRGIHEPQEELCFHHLLKTLDDDANMIELGAWWCWYSIWFNKTVKNPYNLCIEPVRNFIEGGTKNAKLNDCKNMEFLIASVGKPIHPAKPVDGVEQLDTEHIISHTGRNKFFDIVHSDIQGAEGFMLESSINVLDKIGYFVISTHGASSNIIKWLESKDFTILQSHSESESASVDGLVIGINNKHISKYEKNIDGSLVDYFKNNCKITKKL